MGAAAKPTPTDHPYRMRDLCDRTGVPRQAIHFYIQQGLLPEGRKTGRNMAYYGDPHVERILLIRRLQQERFLPLRAIRAVISGESGAFTPAQQRLIGEVKERLDKSLVRAESAEGVSVKELLLRTGMDRQDFDEMVSSGLFATRQDEHGRFFMRVDDIWMLELWTEVRAAGFTRELGFTPAVALSIHEKAISGMFERETSVLLDLLQGTPASEIAKMVELGLPIIHRFMVRYHETKVRDFFAAMG